MFLMFYGILFNTGPSIENFFSAIAFLFYHPFLFLLNVFATGSYENILQLLNICSTGM